MNPAATRILLTHVIQSIVTSCMAGDDASMVMVHRAANYASVAAIWRPRGSDASADERCAAASWVGNMMAPGASRVTRRTI
jgi:hypothetical protein